MTKEETIFRQYLQDLIRSSEKPEPMSINELSLQVFGDEKYMASREGQKMINQVMKRYKINKSFLPTYKTLESFIFVRIPNSNSKNALIIENKDTYGSVRDALLNGNTILGMEFSVVIYGEGRKIQSSFAFMEKSETESIRDIEHFYYFGDIDAEGIDIFNKLKMNYREYDIRAFAEGYRYLYDHKDLMRDKQKKKQTRLFVQDVNRLKVFTANECMEISQLCNMGFLIPQEVMNKKVIEQFDVC